MRVYCSQQTKVQYRTKLKLTSKIFQLITQLRGIFAAHYIRIKVLSRE